MVTPEGDYRAEWGRMHMYIRHAAERNNHVAVADFSISIKNIRFPMNTGTQFTPRVWPSP